ncbi:MAG TPA: winged helix-turn-helix domain-containing protein [Pyrinomonadaceae bacterium]|nr:winged helix-turn-helix domain-containing protein [Pyrinomonadaceae bacterium]
MSNETTARCFNFGNFTLDLGRRLLLRDGEPVPLTPKAFDTLAVLVRRSGHVVSKDELLEEIWTDAFVEESTIAQNVFTLRKALGQHPTGNQFIETVPKHGYRFVADVKAIDGVTNARPEIGQHGAAPRNIAVGEKIGDAEISDAEIGNAETVDAASEDAGASDNEGRDFSTVNVAAGAASNSPTARRRDLHPPKQSARFNFQTKLLVPVMLLLAVAVAAGVFRFTRINKAASDFATPSPLTRTTQLTNTGQVLRAAVSPDGKYVAYIQSERGQESLWVRQVEMAGGIEIVQPSGDHFVGITFSPDSNSIFYVKYGKDLATSGLYQVPVLGGAARKILTDIDSQITFAPDKRRFAFVLNDLSRKEAHLIIANLDDAEQRQLVVYPGVHWMTDAAPAWSPDGKIIIFTARIQTSKSASTTASLVEVQVADGKQTIFKTRQWDAIQAIEWLADGTGLIVAARDNASLLAHQLWQIDYPGGATRAITKDLNSYSSAGVSADMKSLVTILHRRIANLWIAPGDRSSEAVRILSGNSKDLGWTLGVEWLRDDKIIYGSTASGKEDVWLMNADGSDRKQLTTTAGANFEPTVSDDGRTVVYVSKAADATQNLWKMNLANGDRAQLTNGGFDLRPDISPDGRWVVYMSVIKDSPTLWKTSLGGSEAAIRLSDKIAAVPRVSPDGRFIACFYRAQVETYSKLAVLPFDGGEPVKVFDRPPTTFVEAGIRWTPDGRGLTFIDNRDGVSNIWLQPLDGSPAKQLTNFTSETIFRFAWSPDGKMFVAERGTEIGDIVLINK